MSSRNDVEYLVASSDRPQILSACSDEAMRPRDIVAHCPACRSTVHRALNGFLERGWIEEHGSSYATTPFGDDVLDQYHDLLGAVGRAHQFGSWFQAVDVASESLPDDVLERGSVVTATATNPTAPLERVSDLVATTGASIVRIVLPSFATVLTEAFERVRSTGGSLHVAVPERVLEECADRFDADADESNVVVRSVDADPPFGMVVLESRVSLLGFDSRNRLVASLESDSPAVREWALDRFESVAVERATTA